MRNILIATLLLPLFATAITITNQYIIPADQQVEDEQWIIATVAQPEGIFLNDLTILCANPLFFSGTYEGNINGIAGMETALIGTAKRNVRITGKVVRIEGNRRSCNAGYSGTSCETVNFLCFSSYGLPPHPFSPPASFPLC